jgi:ABC-type polysaccharide/polyol phosphate export permease
MVSQLAQTLGYVVTYAQLLNTRNCKLQYLSVAPFIRNLTSLHVSLCYSFFFLAFVSALNKPEF